MDQVILVVDDDVTSLKLVTGVLEKHFHVAAATSGAMALHYLERNTPDLVLLDVNMPDMDGFALKEAMADNPATAEIPVVFLTGAPTPQSEAECIEKGAVDIVIKPVVPIVLENRIRQILELIRLKKAAKQEA